jgi:MFS transporter, FHS family, glucose/mannose:H+ symporter
MGPDAEVKSRLLVIHLGFALTGVVTTLLGPILPLLSAQWALNDAQAGRLFTVQFASSVGGSLVASRVLSRWGAAWTVLIGMFVITAGVACIAIGSFASGLAGIALYGIGLGFALPATNLWVSEMVPEGRAAALNLLNFSWTVGAVTAPVMIAYLLKPIGLAGILLLLAASCGVVALIEAGSVRSGHTPRISERQGRLPSSLRGWFALATALLLFLYVGVENGFAGWVPSFASRTLQTSEQMTAYVQSGFWMAILLGRLFAPVVLKKVSPKQLIIGGSILAACGIATTLASSNLAMMTMGVVISGLGLAAIFPTAIAIFTEWFGTGGLGTIVLGVCGLGGAVVPWMVGVVSSRTANLRFAMGVNLITAAAVLGVFLWMISLTARPAQAKSAGA